MVPAIVAVVAQSSEQSVEARATPHFPESAMTLDEFVQWRLRGGPDRVWLRYPALEVYVRLGKRRIGERRYSNVLDIANVEARESGKGTFTRFLEEAEATVRTFKLDALYIELVQDRRFADFFIRHGFLLCDPGGDQALSFAKLFEHSAGRDDETN